MLCLVGDGGLGMALAELETVARLALPVTVVVFDDAALSLTELKQGAGHGGPAAARTVSDVEAELDRVGSGPFLLDARIDPAGYREVLRVSRG